MNIYLSGPVHGFDYAEVVKGFEAARDALRKRYPHATVFVPTQGVPHGVTHEQAMCICVHTLTFTVGDAMYGKPAYDALVRLPGWENSEGCNLETTVATACGITICDLADALDGALDQVGIE